MADNIRQYTSPVDKLQPSETGAETLARMGRVEDENLSQAGRSYGNTVKSIGGDIDNYEYMQEVSQGAAGLAVMHSNLTTQWNKLAQSTDPNDITIQQQFMDQADDQLNQWKEKFQTKRGQNWAEEQANKTGDHFWEKTSSDMGVRAGNAIIGNLKTTLKGYSETAYNDPTSIDHALGQADALLAAKKEASQGTLDEEQIGKLDSITDDMKNEIVKSGLKGLAERNPQALGKTLDSGAFSGYISGDEASDLKKYAMVQAHGKNVDRQNQARMQQQKVQQASEKANTQYLGALTQGQIPSATQIISDPNLSNRQKSLWVARDGILSMSSDDLHTATLGDNFSQAAQAIYGNKQITPDGLLAGIRRGEISPAGATQLQKLASMQKTPEGIAELAAQKSVLTNVQSQLVKGGAYASDPVGQKNFNAFMNTFYSSWDAAIKKGATPAQLSDPNSKDYIGNLATQFKRPDAQAISDVLKAKTEQNNAQPPAAAQPKNWIIKNGALVPAGAQ